MRVDVRTTTAWDVVHKVSSAFETNDRNLVEQVLADDFTFSSPPDPQLDREQYFERCWPSSKSIKAFRSTKVLEQDGEVFVTCDLEKADGTKGPNTEFFVVDDGKVTKTDVYFGPSL